MLLLAAVLAHGLLDYRFPDQVMRRADRHRPLAILREWVISHLFEEQSLETGPWDKKVFALRARERMGDRVRMIGDSILGVTAADWDAWSLPDGLHGLYYLARPFRVSWRYGAKFFEALSRR
jgi:hypothetical protein